MIPEDDGVRDAEQDAEDAKEDSEPIKYTHMGSEDCPIDPEDESIEFAMTFRIPKIQGLENCVNMKVSATLNTLIFCSFLVPWIAQKLDQKDGGT